MSRQDQTLLNPLFELEQTVHAAQMEYMESYNVSSKRPQPLGLAGIKKAVERVFGVFDIAKNTNAKPYPDARKLFVRIAHRNSTLDEGAIMSFIGRHRTSFYHNMSQGENLIQTDKELRDLYHKIIAKLGAGTV